MKTRYRVTTRFGTMYVGQRVQVESKLSPAGAGWQVVEAENGNVSINVRSTPRAKIELTSTATVTALVGPLSGQEGYLKIRGGTYWPDFAASWDFGSQGKPTHEADDTRATLVSWVQEGSVTHARWVSGHRWQ